MILSNLPIFYQNTLHYQMQILNIYGIFAPYLPMKLLLMAGNCQKTHKHGLPKRKRIFLYRISVTFRELY